MSKANLSFGKAYKSSFFSAIFTLQSTWQRIAHTHTFLLLDLICIYIPDHLTRES